MGLIGQTGVMEPTCPIGPIRPIRSINENLLFPQIDKMDYHPLADAGTVGTLGPGWPREKRRR